MPFLLCSFINESPEGQEGAQLYVKGDKTSFTNFVNNQFMAALLDPTAAAMLPLVLDKNNPIPALITTYSVPPNPKNKKPTTIFYNNSIWETRWENFWTVMKWKNITIKAIRGSTRTEEWIVAFTSTTPTFSGTTRYTPTCLATFTFSWRGGNNYQCVKAEATRTQTTVK